MIKSKEELLATLKQRIGDDTSDDAIAIIEDFSDTLNSYDTENWKQKYEDNDKMWREKYKARFFEATDKVKEEQKEDIKDDSEKKTFEELFEKREG